MRHGQARQRRSPWRLSTSTVDTEDVYFAEKPLETNALGSSWLGGTCRIFRTSGADAARRGENSGHDTRGRRARLQTFRPRAERGDARHRGPYYSQACYWDPGNLPSLDQERQREQLNARPLRTLKIVDPYLHTEWQISLLRGPRETVQGRRLRAGAGRDVRASFRKSGNWLRYTADPVRRRATNPHCNCLRRRDLEVVAAATDSLLRQHQRFIEGSREDGSRFLVLLERGLDFIAFDRRRGVRATRESYLVVKEE